MLRFGIIGMNEGNGHPYSFSAIFNGYDPDALPECPYAAIRSYLPAWHRNEKIIGAAKVTHIWTQDPKLSESVARVSRIPNIVSDRDDLLGNVDAVILARDDPHNHWEMARPFIEDGMPIYVDKVLAHDLPDLKRFISAVGRGYPIMAGSSSRFTASIEKAGSEIADFSKVRSVHGVSCVSWIRYANHLLDGICRLFGTEFESVQNVGEPGNDIVRIRYRTGLDLVLQVRAGLSLPIEFTCYSDSGQAHYTCSFTDPDLHSYFIGFYNMLAAFTGMVQTRKQPVPFEELVKISKVVIAGEMSREQGGRKILFDELN